MNVQIEGSIKDVLVQAEPNFFGDGVGGVLVGREAEHKVAGVTQVDESELQLVVVIVVEDEVVYLFASTVRQGQYESMSKKVGVGTCTSRMGPVV